MTYHLIGILGVVMEAFFNEKDGVFGNDPKWEKIGIQIAGALVIILWSGFWSGLTFFALKTIKWKGNNILRLDAYSGRHQFLLKRYRREYVVKFSYTIDHI